MDIKQRRPVVHGIFELGWVCKYSRVVTVVLPSTYRMILTSVRTFAAAIICVVSIPVTTIAQVYSGPGGTPNNPVWMDASTVTAANNAIVTSWADRSSNGIVFSTPASTPAAPTKGPTYVANAINTKPAFSFDGTLQYFESPYAAALSPTTMTLVIVSATTNTTTNYKSVITSRNGNSGYMVYGTQANPNTWEFWYGQGTGSGYYIFNPNWGLTSNAWNIMTYTTTATAFNAYVNNGNPSSGTGTYRGNTTRPTRIGAGNTDAALVAFYHLGSIAEIAIFPKVLSAAERMVVTNALAWKYGITLSTNYAITGAAQEYSNDIGGLGRTATETLTTGEAGYVRINAPTTSLVANEYLFWGNNRGAMVATTSGVPTNTFNETIRGTPGTYTVAGRLGRIWKAYERSNTGATNIDVGTLNISIDLKDIPGPKRIQDLVLLVDRDNDGFADATYQQNSSSGIFIPPATDDLSDGIVTFSNVNLNNNDSFTLGTLNIIQTPLPVTLLNLTATITTEQQVAIQWQTATEKNSAYFVIERSANATAWTATDTVAAAGNSNKLRYYSARDRKPLGGQVYYRVRSVDFDGTFEYSDIVTIRVPIVFGLYPNPATNEIFIETDHAIDAGQPLLFGNTQGLFQEIYAEQVTDHKLRLDTSSFEPGVYLIKIGTRWARIVIL